ncbi:MAG: UDP-N-acetylmuramate--L-alanine ligase [Elusimicrobia bacterium]|nr:MAG: UDP-N-acetylmuramate--L-alanine ligase [Elusimicrobiota bacterium]
MKGFVRHIHFVGIGGIGMSGIAQVLLNLGYRVSGSDLKGTELTRRLKKAGATVFEGHHARNVRGAEVVVTSTAIGGKNPEVKEARRQRIPVIKRVEMLAELARLKRTIAVTGTHGKTTTTAMIGVAMQGAGLDPTVIVGGQVADLGSNAKLGLGDYLVAEADESDGSFLRLWPLVTVVTNIDNDHLEHYGGFEELKRAFKTHLERLPFYGAAVLCVDDPELKRIAGDLERPVVSYGFSTGAQWRGVRKTSGTGMRLEITHAKKKVGSFRLKVAGKHNAQNALAAVAVAGYLGLDLKKVFRALESFSGVGRRLEKLGETHGVVFIDDYGHHPTEVRATLSAVRELYGRRRVVVLFQPHRYSRTKALYREFGKSFAAADLVLIADVYGAGEKPMRGVDAGLIVKAAKKAGVSAARLPRVVDLVRELRPGDVVLTLGAGDIWKTGMDLLRRLGSVTLSEA